MNDKDRQILDSLLQRLNLIEHVLINEIKHELRLHRWLLGIILAGGLTVMIALIIILLEVLL